MLYFLKKKKLKKSPQRWGLRPQTHVCLRRLGAPPPKPLSCYPHNLLQLLSKTGVCSANVIAVKKYLKIAIMSFAPHLLQTLAGYPSKYHWLRFLGIVTITTYIISYLSEISGPLSKLAPWLKPPNL